MPELTERKYSICILDDGIPLEDYKGLISHCMFVDLCSDKEKWKDKPLYKLIESLTSAKLPKKEESSEEENKYIISGFSNCNFFLNHIVEDIFSPDIVVFDWDYPGIEDPSPILLEILESQYSMIFIFTGADTETKVESAIKGSFDKYKNRIKVLYKDTEESLSDLQSGIEDALKTFSFQYSHHLKQKTLKALDSILSSFGQFSIKEFVKFFGELRGGDRVLSFLDFNEIIADKLKTKLINDGDTDVPALPKVNNGISEPPLPEEKIKELWGFRLYHQPKDDIVRRGDIFKLKDETFMVISADCDLARFWKKNLGFLTIVPLMKICDNALKEMLNGAKVDFKGFSLTSLTNPSSIENITVLPGLSFKEKNGENNLTDYVVMTKSVSSIYIQKPDKDDKNNNFNPESPLTYRHIAKKFKTISFEDRKKIAEPFLSPLIQFVIGNITSLGVPDFSAGLQGILKDDIKNLKNDI